MSNFFTTDLEPFDGKHVGTRRPDAHAVLFGPRRHEPILSNMEVQELSSTNRITRRMAQEEVSAMEQGASIAMFRKVKGCPVAAQGHERRARLAMNEAVLQPSTSIQSNG